MAAVTSVMTLNDLKPRLGIDLSDMSQDVELQQFIAEVCDVIEYIVGPVRGQQFTEWHEGMQPSILLQRRPLVSIESVTEYIGTMSYSLTQQSPDTSPLDGFGYFLYPEEGIIERTVYGMPAWFAALPWWTAKTPGWYTSSPQRYGAGRGRVKVVYTTGRTSVPAGILGAAIELARINYQQTQQSGRRAGRAFELGDEVGSQEIRGYYVPNRVREMLLPFTQSRGLR